MNAVQNKSVSEDGWGEVCSEIMNSFQLLKHTLKERAECHGNTITIFDPPYTIEILRNEEQIVLKAGEELAVLTKNGLSITSADDGDVEVLKDWCTALTALTFKRYIARKA